ncbi:MAG: hypothetical protein M3374_04840 [Pseudomonadota bacterium]|nr:hypothetical protein [Pseudomonadota bacterium]
MMNEIEIDAAISRLELDMHDLARRHQDLFAYASAWAERYDAIIAATPSALRHPVEQRLHRIAVRWGVAAGVRITTQFPTYKPQG